MSEETPKQEIVPAGIVRAKLAAKAAALRASGATLSQTAKELRVSIGRVVRLLAQHYKRQREHTAFLAAGAVAEEEARVLAVIRAAFGVMTDSDVKPSDRLKAGMAVIRASESRRDLLGVQRGITPAGTTPLVPLDRPPALPDRRPFADVPGPSDEDRRDAVLRLLGASEWEIGKLHGHGVQSDKKPESRTRNDEEVA